MRQLILDYREEIVSFQTSSVARDSQNLNFFRREKESGIEAYKRMNLQGSVDQESESKFITPRIFEKAL